MQDGVEALFGLTRANTTLMRKGHGGEAIRELHAGDQISS